MYRNGSLSLVAVLAIVICAGAATADPVTDARNYNAAKDQVIHDRMKSGFDHIKKDHDIDSFANSVRNNDLKGAVDNVINIEHDKQNIQRDRVQTTIDHGRENAARNKLDSNFQ
jgi:hypothetical protein